MGFDKRSMVVFLMMVLGFCGVCTAAVYKVGDSSGWTENGKVDYKAWSNSKKFHVGDTIVFEYDNTQSNVVRVNHHDYNACNNIHSYFSLNSGNDSFVIPKFGHYYFISGMPNHCQAGQRVDIRVSNRDDATSAPTPAHPKSAPAPAHPTSAPAPAHAKSAPAPAHATSAPAPSPKKNNAAVSIPGIWFAMVVAIFVCFYGFGY